jgi:hypothetical protein
MFAYQGPCVGLCVPDLCKQYFARILLCAQHLPALRRHALFQEFHIFFIKPVAVFPYSAHCSVLFMLVVRGMLQMPAFTAGY